MKIPLLVLLLIASVAASSGCTRNAQDRHRSLNSGIALAPIEFAARQPMPGKTLSESLASPYSTRALEQAREAIQHHDGLRFEVVGFTDASECEGSECMRLSAWRAKAVRSRLIARGVSESALLQATGKGSRFPLDLGDSEDSRSVNRRVEILLTTERSVRTACQGETEGSCR